MNTHWKAVEQCSGAVCCSISKVCNLGKSLNFGLDTVRSERVKNNKKFRSSLFKIKRSKATDKMVKFITHFGNV